MHYRIRRNPILKMIHALMYCRLMSFSSRYINIYMNIHVKYLLAIRLLSNGYHSLFLSLGVERPGLESDHSPWASGGVKNAKSFTSTPPHIQIMVLAFGCMFIAWWLINHGETLAFSFR
jgi:ABC-type uncharacterized transport system permease subunit